MKEQINPDTIILGTLNTPPLLIDQPEKNNQWKTFRATQNHRLSVFNKHIYRILHLITVKCTFFSIAHGIFSKI